MPSLLRRRNVVLLTVALVVVVGLAVAVALVRAPSPRSSAGATSPSATHPNIVFVLTDDLADNLVQYMPHVLALEKSGTTFADYTVTDSLCCPSRSSIFSGRFPHDTGVFTNSGTDGGFHLFHGQGEEDATYATALQSAGYRTAMMGKYLNGYLPADTQGGSTPYVPPGWDEWDVAGNGYPELGYNLNQDHTVQQYGKDPADYLTDVLSGKASSFIDASSAAHTPFAIEVATFTPHAPYVPAPQDASSFPGLTAPRTPAYDVLPTDAPAWLAGRAPLTAQEQTAIDVDFRKRVQDVQSVDRMIAGIEATLAKDGVAGSTDIVFSSDNGYHMGEHRLNPGKMTAFDTDVNVPLVVSGPGVSAGATSDEPVQNIDLAPTFETLAGATVGATVDGHTITPLLAGASVPDWRTSALVEHHGPDNDATDPDDPDPDSGNPPSYTALRTTAYTYVEYTGGATEFYDRTTDPDELRNTAATLTPTQLGQLHTVLSAMASCHDATACWSAAHGAPAI